MNRLQLCPLLLLMSTAAGQDPLIRPCALVPGDTITIIAPAGDLDRTRIERAVKRLENMGFKVKLPPNLYRRRGYLAGTDEERAAEVMAAFLDPDVKAIFCGAGGYGTTRILDRLDYDAIRRNPKILTGFSDITALHLAIHKRCGLVTFHSPVASYGLGNPENPLTFSLDYFWRALLRASYFDENGQPRPPGYEYVPPRDQQVRTLASGVARGRLTGGNLTLISSVMGTPYEIETEGRIIFIEDRNEEPYRIDRFLSQLRLAGKLQKLAGVVLGVFVDCEPKDPRGSLSLAQVFSDYFEHLGVPVIANFPVGHFKYNATMPLGVDAELDANKKTLRLLENPVMIPESGTTAASTSAD